MDDSSGNREPMTENGTNLRQRVAELEHLLEEARARGEKYRVLVENEDEPVIQFDLDFRVLYVNPSYCRAFGVTESELLGQPFLPLIHEDDRERVKTSLSRVTSPPYLAGHEERARTPEGWRWYSWSVRAILDDEGSITSIIGVGRDITEKKEALQALEESEQRYRLLAEHTLDVIWTMDMDLRFTYVNPAISEMFGFTPEAWIGTNLKDHCPAEDFAEMGRVIAGSLAAGPGAPGVVFESRIENRDGEPVPVEVHGKVFFDESGRPVRLQGTTRDISERKASEARYLHGKETLEEAQEVAGIGSWEYDLASDKPIWSKEMFRIFGFDAEQGEPSWKEHLQVVHPDDWTQLDQAIGRAMNEGRNYSEKFRIIRPDGRVVWAHTIGRAALDESGKVVRLNGTVQDITELVRAEAERERLQEQLIQAQKMESIGRLAGGVAHDFNNLLTAIQGFSELVDDSLHATDPIRQDVGEIRKAADSAAALTSQLLAFSRKQIVSPRAVDINRAVERSEKMLRRIIGEDIEFSFQPQGGIGPIYIDPGQVDQVLINLAVNSRDAMPDGGRLSVETAGVTVERAVCRTCGADLSGEFVRLRVGDTGHGMGEETIGKIFDPFFTTKGLGKGTGLGLSTVHGIVHQNAGHIEVDSAPGKGSNFSIYLPFAEDKDAAAENDARPVDVRGQEVILVVEDQELVRKLAVRTLRAYGYKVFEASSGGEALLACEDPQERIDLLLTDVVMPQMSGRDLMTRLHQTRPGLKGLYMSGYSEDTIARHGVLEDGINFLQKPFRPQELVRRVRQILDAGE